MISRDDGGDVDHIMMLKIKVIHRRDVNGCIDTQQTAHSQNRGGVVPGVTAMEDSAFEMHA